MSPRRAQSGFSILMIGVILLMAAGVVGAVQVLSRVTISANRQQATSTRMAAVEAAVVQFVQQAKRMPCPADGALDSGSANAGIEMARTAGAGCTDQTRGVVPWRALGLSESDATDGWGRRFAFRVRALDAADGGMNLSRCDPGGTGPVSGTPPELCISTCTAASLLSDPATCTSRDSAMAGKGLQVRNLAGTVLMNPAAVPNTGAAFVLTSPGETGGGSYNVGGFLQASSTTDGAEEAKNYANLALQPYYVDDATNTAAGTAHFDDIVLRPTVLSVLGRAGLRERTQP